MMRYLNRGVRCGLLLAAGALFLPQGVSGGVSGALPEVDPTRAAALEEQAQALHDTPSRWSEASRLYREAAELRADDDDQKVSALRMAAWTAHYARRSREALEHAEAAGRLSLRRGDLVQAGEALADAAHLARALGQADRAETLAQEVRLLAGSPFLADGEREALLGRIQA